MVTAGVEANVWDPSIATFADGSAAFAWSEYRDGAYRVVVRRRDADGVLARTARHHVGQRLRAASQPGGHRRPAAVVRVRHHHGRRPRRERTHQAAPGRRGGCRPRRSSRACDQAVTASLPSCCPTSRRRSGWSPSPTMGCTRLPGDLAPRLNVVPSGLPKLVATRRWRLGGGLPGAPQAAADDLLLGGRDPGADAPTAGSLRRPSAAPTALSKRSASRRAPAAPSSPRRPTPACEGALDWTEGFGGRECPYLLEHQGSVVWHGVHGVGTIVTGEISDRWPGCRHRRDAR
ncbi:MAG: hypothetical protein WKF73_15545 [Nocardioidaceae bacterium]